MFQREALVSSVILGGSRRTTTQTSVNSQTKRMAFHFCPQCGTKLQPDFKFCPSCGEKLPCPEAAGPTVFTLSPSTSVEKFTTVEQKGTTSSPVRASLGTSIVSSRPPLHKTRNSLRLDNLSIKDAPSTLTPSVNVAFDNATEKQLHPPPKKHSATFKGDSQGEPLQSSPLTKSPKNADEIIEEAEVSAIPLSSPIMSPNSKSPLKGKGKTKKSKVVPALEPLQEGTEVIDTTGKKWILTRLLNHAAAELIYEVEKWVKQNKMDFIGLPQSVGFGLHSDSYRCILIFPNMGQSLQSLMNKQNNPLSEVTVLQLACRILDVLRYIHSNEYVHADINAENIYIKEGQGSQVYLVGYSHAYRYCPGGQHVEYSEGSRIPNEGAIESISLDSHNGAAPSRRSDLQSLGYCMLYWHTGTLPWIALSHPDQIALQKKKYKTDVLSLLQHCFGKKKVSGAFQCFLSAVMPLEYNEQPNYSALKSGSVKL
ncbi:hypothetical protein WMY93_013285 [Mugilogobius chulae]|uniref:Protein kinase domain-containing protein n=1 Tax=Mugilogobius chulae TaxID=88201 RepID=A0AAW0PB06_9GOBI